MKLADTTSLARHSLRLNPMKLFQLAFVLLLLINRSLFAADAPVQVFVLAGQSNMEGQGFIAADPKRNEGRGSLEYIVQHADTAARYKHLQPSDGKWLVRDDVSIWYLGRSGPLTVGYGARPELIGPELGFGYVVGEATTAPVLLIKCAWGGKSLAVDFRPPSSGKVPYSLGGKSQEALDAHPEIVGHYYREAIKLTKEVLGKLPELFPQFGQRGYELAGFGWHQGWNDRVNDKFNAEYEKNLAHLIALSAAGRSSASM